MEPVGTVCADSRREPGGPGEQIATEQLVGAPAGLWQDVVGLATAGQTQGGPCAQAVLLAWLLVMRCPCWNATYPLCGLADTLRTPSSRHNGLVARTIRVATVIKPAPSPDTQKGSVPGRPLARPSWICERGRVIVVIWVSI